MTGVRGAVYISLQNFGDPTYAHTVWPRKTKFGTYVGEVLVSNRLATPSSQGAGAQCGTSYMHAKRTARLWRYLYCVRVRSCNRCGRNSVMMMMVMMRNSDQILGDWTRWEENICRVDHMPTPPHPPRPKLFLTWMLMHDLLVVVVATFVFHFLLYFYLLKFQLCSCNVYLTCFDAVPLVLPSLLWTGCQYYYPFRCFFTVSKIVL